MKDVNQYFKDARGLAANFDATAAKFATIITRWPYAIDPTDPAVYGELWPLEWQEVKDQVNTAILNLFRSPAD